MINRRDATPACGVVNSIGQRLRIPSRLSTVKCEDSATAAHRAGSAKQTTRHEIAEVRRESKMARPIFVRSPLFVGQTHREGRLVFSVWSDRETDDRWQEDARQAGQRPTDQHDDKRDKDTGQHTADQHAHQATHHTTNRAAHRLTHLATTRAAHRAGKMLGHQEAQQRSNEPVQDRDKQLGNRLKKKHRGDDPYPSIPDPSTRLKLLGFNCFHHS